jgi:hypothetical protein
MSSFYETSLTTRATFAASLAGHCEIAVRFRGGAAGPHTQVVYPAIRSIDVSASGPSEV